MGSRLNSFERKILLGHVIITGVTGELTVLRHRVKPVLYLEVHVVYCLPVRYNLLIGSPTHCHIADRVWRRTTRGRRICFGDRRHIGLSSSNHHQTILDTFQTEGGDKGMDKTSLFAFTGIFRVDVDLCTLLACRHHQKMPILIPTSHQ